MKLVVHELNTDIYQAVRPKKNTIVESIRPHLYKHKSPIGSLVVEIHDNKGDLISTSEPVEISSISDEDYFHGFIRFDIFAYLQKDVIYRIYIKGIDGYVFSESDWVGVCNSYDFQSYEPEYENSHGMYAPLDIEIWSRKEK